MKLARRGFLRTVAGLAAFPLSSNSARAESYPSRPVRVIVPFAPGGQTDVVARLIAQQLSEQLKQQFYAENVPGAGGNIGAGRAAQAAPDGHTIIVVDGIGFTANPNLYNRVPYDPAADFDPVGIAATTMHVLAVNPDLPAKSIEELIALIRAAPGKYSYGSAGVGTGAHLTGELFKHALKLDLVHVPYGGGGPAIAAAVAGHTPISFGSPAATIPQVKDGKLRALAVGGSTRVRELPEIPTIREAGYAEVVCDVWIGILVPAGTPKDIVTLLHDKMAHAVGVKEVRSRLVTLGFEPAATGPEELADVIKAEVPKWAGVIRAAGIRTN
jgi:tripartite-type tricarboxylate transporter receptor subunit TctC